MKDVITILANLNSGKLTILFKSVTDVLPNLLNTSFKFLYPIFNYSSVGLYFKVSTKDISGYSVMCKITGSISIFYIYLLTV